MITFDELYLTRFNGCANFIREVERDDDVLCEVDELMCDFIMRRLVQLIYICTCTTIAADAVNFLEVVCSQVKFDRHHLKVISLIPIYKFTLGIFVCNTLTLTTRSNVASGTSVSTSVSMKFLSQVISATLRFATTSSASR